MTADDDPPRAALDPAARPVVRGEPSHAPSPETVPAHGSNRNPTMEVPQLTESLHGQCLLADGQEYICVASGVSPAGADIHLRARTRIGEAVTCRIDLIGVVRGHVTRRSADGFSMVFAVTDARRARLTAQIAWLASSATGRVERRVAPRIVPLQQNVKVAFDGEAAIDGVILDLSLSGAAIAVDGAPSPRLGQRVRIGKRYAAVVRLLENGFAAQFVLPFAPETLNPHVVL